jgi:hypothetical protein
LLVAGLEVNIAMILPLSSFQWAEQRSYSIGIIVWSAFSTSFTLCTWEA